MTIIAEAAMTLSAEAKEQATAAQKKLNTLRRSIANITDANSGTNLKNAGAGLLYAAGVWISVIVFGGFVVLVLAKKAAGG